MILPTGGFGISIYTTSLVQEQSSQEINIKNDSERGPYSWGTLKEANSKSLQRQYLPQAKLSPTDKVPLKMCPK